MTETYAQKARRLGISRGDLEEDRQLESMHCGSTWERPPVVFHRHVGPRVGQPEQVDKPAQGNCPLHPIAGWWERMTPEERRRHSAQRSANAKRGRAKDA